MKVFLVFVGSLATGLAVGCYLQGSTPATIASLVTAASYCWGSLHIEVNK